MKTHRSHILERPLANAFAPGAGGDAQRRAMWAKRNNPQEAGKVATPVPQPPPRTLIPVPNVPIPGYPKQPPQTGDGHQLEPPSAPVDPTQAILDKIAQLRRGLPPGAPPPAGTITVGRPSGPVPTSIPIPPRRPTPAPTPGHPDPKHPGQTPPSVVVPKKTKKSYVKNWYRGATTP
jgi:hypothetical protein